MDILQHSVQGGLITSVITNDPYIIATGAALGALPDIIGYAEKLIFKNESWQWYLAAHKLKWYYLWCLPYSLHIILDKFTHGDGKRWWKLKERLWLEIVGWILTLGMLCVSW